MSANGLSSRCLRARSAATGASSIGPTGEVEAADPLDGQDRPVAQRDGRGGHGIVGVRVRARPREQGHGRPAHRTRVGLGMKAPVGGILVLGLARRAHGKAGHRGQGPVIGDSAHDREPRPAVGAVDERIAVAAIAGVAQLAQAVLAGGAVGAHRSVGGRRHRGCRGSRSRCAPVAVASVGSIASITASGGASGPSRARKSSTARRVPLDLQHHPARVVEHEARRAPARRPAGRRRAGSRRPARPR